jgi:hypothetical protein
MHGKRSTTSCGAYYSYMRPFYVISARQDIEKLIVTRFTNSEPTTEPNLLSSSGAVVQRAALPGKTPKVAWRKLIFFPRPGFPSDKHRKICQC